MKAMVCTAYGPPEVLQLQELEKPTPKDNEVLVKVQASSVNYGDLAARNFRQISAREFYMPAPLWLMSKFYFGLSKPRVTILGSELAGEVEAVGSSVRAFRPGDEVFGYLGQSMGAYAEYHCAAENAVLAIKPANMNYDEAAVVPYGTIMALYLLREKGKLQRGQKILIVGASGGIGSAAVQLAKHHFGANVTGVCSTPRVEFVQALGADRVIDYTKEDYTQSDQTYDLIFDVLGKSSYARVKKTLSAEGILLLASFKSGHLLDMLRTSISGKQKVICALAPGSTEDLLAVKDLIEAGTIKAIIDKRFPLEQAADAHRYVEGGHKKGHVAITLDT